MTLASSRGSGNGSVDNTALSEALTAAERGWPVFPVHGIVDGICTCRRAGDCPDPGKHPCETRSFHSATTEMTIIQQYWAKQWPNCNWGLATGKASGVVVLDIDPHRGGERTLDEIEDAIGPLPETVECLSGGGGRHIYFTWPAEPVSSRQDALGPGLDVKADGGYVVLPGGRHASGRRYEWELSSTPDDTPLAALPEALRSRLDVPQRSRENRERRGNPSALSALSALSVAEAIARTRPVAEGQRNRLLFQFARMVAAMPEYQHATPAQLRPVVKQWHDAALPAIGTKPFEDTWGDFLYGWQRVEYPAGSGPLNDALERADAAELPYWAKHYDNATTKRLVKLSRELAGADGQFYLSCHTAADLLGGDPKTMWRRLNMLMAEGVLECVKKGTAQWASRYRYTGDE